MYDFLVVDDEALICSGISDTLETLGKFRMFQAGSGVEALEILKKNPIKAMLLDISMPDMNGIELMETIADDPDKPLTIIVSGYDEFEYAKKAMNYGAIDYILKPIDSEDVLEIGRRIFALLEEKEKKERRLDLMRSFVLNNRNVIKQKILYDILHHSTSTLDLVAIDELYGINLTGTHFCVALIYLRHSRNMAEIDFQVALKQVEEIIEEEIGGDRAINLFNMENARYVLIFCSEGPMKKMWIQNILDRLMERISQIGDLECYIGKGEEVQGIENIANSYFNADDALDYRSIFGSGFIYDISDYRQDDKILRLGKIDREFSTYLNFMQYDAAIEKLHEYFGFIEENAERFTASQLHYLLSKIDVGIMSVLFENGFENLDFYMDEPFQTGQKPSLDAIRAIRKRAVKRLERIAGDLEEGYLENSKKIAMAIKKYIEENYPNHELSVHMIAEAMNYSSNYIGNVFKKEYGIAISEYINKIRIDNAKKLMRESKLKNYEIAYLVGFSDQHYFSKTFKKYEKLSPKEYRTNEM